MFNIKSFIFAVLAFTFFYVAAVDVDYAKSADGSVAPARYEESNTVGEESELSPVGIDEAKASGEEPENGKGTVSTSISGETVTSEGLESAGVKGEVQSIAEREPLYIRSFPVIEPGRNNSNPNAASEESELSPVGIDEAKTSEEEPENGKGTLSTSISGETVTSEGLESAGVKDEVQSIAEIEPLYIRSLPVIEPGCNDSNPIWSPKGDMIAFERNIKGKREIIISRLDGTVVQKVYYKAFSGDDEFDFFLPGILEEVSYNSGISWSAVGDRFAFMSNGGSGNYDVYIEGIGNKNTVRITEHDGKDGQAHWSPSEDTLVFVSGRTGKADLFMRDIAKGITRQITQGEKSYLYPQWSPDGKKISMIYGSNENHDIYLIRDMRKPAESMLPLTTWAYDDLSPKWSPDGKKIAFYSNYNPDNDPKIWSLVVISSDGSDPTKGEGLTAKVMATNIVPDVELGPAWLPDSRRIVYVKNEEHRYNPINIIDVVDKNEVQLKTGTKMNHDISCSVDGTIAFRAQVEQWDRIYIAKLRESK